MRKLTFYHCHSCHLQEIKVQEQYLVHLFGDCKVHQHLLNKTYLYLKPKTTCLPYYGG